MAHTQILDAKYCCAAGTKARAFKAAGREEPARGFQRCLCLREAGINHSPERGVRNSNRRIDFPPNFKEAKTVRGDFFFFFFFFSHPSRAVTIFLQPGCLAGKRLKVSTLRNSKHCFRFYVFALKVALVSSTAVQVCRKKTMTTTTTKKKKHKIIQPCPQ